MYTAMYLPVDKPKVEGCMLMNVRGEVFEWDGIDKGWHSSCRVAEIFIVQEEFNTRKVIGQPSPLAMRWLKAGAQIKESDAYLSYFDTRKGGVEFVGPGLPGGIPALSKFWPEGFGLCVRVRCPTCGEEH